MIESITPRENDSRQRREYVIVCTVAVGLVLLRSTVPTVYEGFYFDSDQAIVGLMAKHLSDFQRFPLFYYSLNYILGVEAWIMVPFFWIAGPSVAAMRAPLIGLNCLVAVWLVSGMMRWLKLRPVMGLVAALPFVMPTPAAANGLLEAVGACVEPFVYVLLLWRLRNRPVAFGALLAFGYLHREFTIFALPALAIAEAAYGRFWSNATIRRGASIAAGFAGVWVAIDALKLYLAGGSLAGQLTSLGNQVCFDPRTLPARAASVLTEALPVLYGGTRTKLDALRMDTPLTAGSPVVGWLLLGALALMVVRVAWKRCRAPRTTGIGFADDGGFAWYLASVGLFTACAYPLSCNVIPGGSPLLRYLLLGLLLPIGCCAAFMRDETSQVLRAAVTSVFVLWAAVNLVDNVRLIRTAVLQSPLNERRALADYLVDHHIRYAQAIYWDAYVLDFLTHERVTVASVDVIRIPEYQQLVDAHASMAYNLARLPCGGGERVASWCVQKR